MSLISVQRGEHGILIPPQLTSLSNISEQSSIRSIALADCALAVCVVVGIYGKFSVQPTGNELWVMSTSMNWLHCTLYYT